MSSGDPHPRAEHVGSHVGFYRVLLWIAVVVVPLFGLLDWDLTYDYYPARLMFSAAALTAIVASHVSATVRRHLRLAPILLCYGLFGWFSYTAYLHSMTLEDMVGLLPIVTGAAMMSRRPAEVALLMAYITVVLGAAYNFLAAPRVGFSALWVVMLTFAGFLGWMSVWRTRLEAALHVANVTLEARVAERTQLLELEAAERRAAEQRANAASEAKSRFLANMSHELRTPLNAVIGYTELVETDLSETDQAHHCDDLAKVGRAARHLLTIIDDVLDLSRVEAGSRSLKGERVAMREVLDDAVVLVQPAIDARRDRLTVEVAADLRVFADREAFGRVLVHLLDNAAKFTADGSISVTACESDGMVDVVVRDTGVGIPEDARAMIFERFTQADDSTTRLHGGVGLGLAICRELVTRMGGTITVTSTVGQGSVFTVRLPSTDGPDRGP